MATNLGFEIVILHVSPQLQSHLHTFQRRLEILHLFLIHKNFQNNFMDETFMEKLSKPLN